MQIIRSVEKRRNVSADNCLLVTRFHSEPPQANIYQKVVYSLS